MKTVRPALAILLFFTVLTGFIYPIAVTGVAQFLFPFRANGSLVMRDGKSVGSELLGQQFEDPGYFWSRPSATSPYPYHGGASSGSNLGPTNPDLISAVHTRADRLRAADPGNTDAIPVDLVTASGSGLDPHISPAAAAYQIPRVARRRGMKTDMVRALVNSYTEPRQFGLFGQPRVNVLRLNLALDEVSATIKKSGS